MSDAVSPKSRLYRHSMSGADGDTPGRKMSDSSATSSDGFNLVGKNIKELVDTIKELSNLGVEASVPLPKIVVVGDQSAGKSSLIEAISEIKVPRDAGTCTRAPLQINLSQSENFDAKWTCSVSLIIQYDYRDPEAINPSEKRTRFHPWVQKDLRGVEPIHFATVFDRNELEGVLRRAQLAVLNPRDHPRTFLSSTFALELTPEAHTLFSPNIVSIDLKITAPGLPNLSFYDLPGVINQTENGQDMYLTKLVKHMVKEYIETGSALVVLAMSMEGDAHNSTAARIVRGVPGCAERTIGVLTKPDRMAHGGNLQDLKAILSGEKFPLGHEYFVTKQPSQEDLNQQISHLEARVRETNFFESEAPWATAEFTEFEPRFGTKALQKALSEKLTMRIAASLPAIRVQVKARLEEIRDELKKYPEPHTYDARQVVFEIWSSLENRIRTDLSQSDMAFRLDWKTASRDFCDQIRSMRPTMITVGKMDQLQFPKPKVDRPKTPVKREKRKAPPATIEISDSESEHTVFAPAPQHQGQKVPSQLIKTFSLDEVRETLHRFSDDDMPDHVDPRAFRSIAVAGLQHWDYPTREFLDRVRAKLGEVIACILHDIFDGRYSTQLHQLTKQKTTDLVNLLFDEQSKTIDKILFVENYKPVTKNDKLLKQYREAEQETLETARFEARMNAHLDAEQLKMDKPMTQLFRADKLKKRQESEKIIGSDPYEQEVRLLADARAYYLVAAGRYVDYVCLSIEAELLERIRQDVKGQLHTILPDDLDDTARHNMCIGLLADDPVRERQRQLLQKEMASLVTAQGCLDDLDRKYRPG